MNQLDESFVEQLQQVLSFLAQWLGASDEALATALMALDQGQFAGEKDILCPLLAEVALNCRQLYDRIAHMHDQVSALLAPEIVVGSDLPITERMFEQWSPIVTSLPQVIEHGGVAVGLEALAVSARALRIPFHVEMRFPVGDPDAWERSGPLLKRHSLRLTLGGVQASDRLGTAYRLELTRHVDVQTIQEPDGVYRRQRIRSALEFTPAPPSDAGMLQLVVSDVLLTHVHAATSR